MKTLINGAVFTLALLASWHVSASPYENLAFALRQQVMINDLRTQCRISQGVSDEKIKSTFLADQENHQTLLNAADALRAGNHKVYAQRLAEIRCPSLL